MTYSFRTNGNFIDFVHTDDTSLMVESVLRSLHNTSRCVTWSLPEDTTRISFVVDDIRVDNFLLAEIDFDGVAIDSQDDFETGIIAAFPGLAGGGSSPGSSYLVYTPSLSQSGTNAPVNNDLGGNTITGTWVRYALSNYAFETDVDFVANKGWVSGMTGNGNGTLIPITTGFSQIDGYLNIYWGDNNGKFYYEVDCYDEAFLPIELEALIGVSNSNINLPEFRIYS